jgi:hypothetical protein
MLHDKLYDTSVRVMAPALNSTRLVRREQCPHLARGLATLHHAGRALVPTVAHDNHGPQNEAETQAEERR